MTTRQHKIASSPRVDSLRWRQLTIGKLFSGLALMSAMAAEADWKTAINVDPMTQKSRCLLTSESQTTSDGYESTPVSLVFNGSSLLVVTESELDPSYNDLKLTVDNKSAVHSDKIVHKNTLVFDKNALELMQLFRSGRVVTVHLRFWPTWEATRTFPVRFRLGDFSKAYDGLKQNCQPANTVQEQIQQSKDRAVPDSSVSVVQSPDEKPLKSVNASTGIAPAAPTTMPSLPPVLPTPTNPEAPSAPETAQSGKQLKPVADGSADISPKPVPKVAPANPPPKKPATAPKKPRAKVSKRPSKKPHSLKNKSSDSWGIKKND